MNRNEEVIPSSNHPQKPASQTLRLQGAPPTPADNLVQKIYIYIDDDNINAANIMVVKVPICMDLSSQV